MSTNGSNTISTSTSASEARATFARILNAPITTTARPDLTGLSVAELDERITDTFESTAASALRLAGEYELDQAAADTLVAGFLAELNMRMQNTVASVLIGGVR